MECLFNILLYLTILFSLTIATSSFATAPSGVIEDWVARYDGPASEQDVPVDIAVVGSSYVYVTGVSDNNSTLEEYAIIKYNSSGVQQRVLRCNGPANIPRSFTGVMVVDCLGNVYVTGCSTIGTEFDYAAVKYNIEVISIRI